MLDFRIHTFLAVCEEMNFTKAAEKLHITQPAVSQHIHYLEKLYDAKLFVHTGRKFTLSAAGELLYRAATTVRNDDRILKENLHQAVGNKIPFCFGVTRTIGDYLIAAPLSRYQKAHPDVDIHMQVSNTQELLEKLQKGELNFALVEGYINSSDFACRTFQREAFTAVASAKHHFAKPPRYLSDLTGEPLIVREKGSGTREILEKNLAAKDMTLENFAKVTEIGSVASIIDFVKADCGITFLYKIAVKKELESGEFTEIQLQDFYMQHDFSFIWNAQSVFSPYYESVCNELRSLVKV